MDVILPLGVVLVAGLLFLLDRALKAIQEGRRRRDAGMRLYAAAAYAESKEKHRRAVSESSKALTTVLPAIRRETDRSPRKVA